jgi:hypothetical protein
MQSFIIKIHQDNLLQYMRAQLIAIQSCDKYLFKQYILFSCELQ